MKIKKRPKGEYLRQIVTEVGLAGRPSVENELEYLNARLTVDELYAVARLLDYVLLTTHVCGHLPYIQALHAIRDDMARKENQK